MYKIILFLSMFIYLSSHSAFAFTSSLSLELLDFFSFDEGRTSGHEEITRQALVKTKDLLVHNRSRVDIARGGIKLLSDLDASKRGLIGALAKNPIIKGVYCSDFPDHSSCIFNLAQYWYGDDHSNIDWHTSSTTQSLHFLRDYHDKKGLVDPYTACMDGRRKIELITRSAVQEWKNKNISNALFLFGHAIHIIQDSFSHAHVQRYGASKNFLIKDICYYGNQKKQELSHLKKENMACFHPILEYNIASIGETILGDSVWNRTDRQYQNTLKNFKHEEVKKCPMTKYQYILFDEDKEACLNSESRLARDATIKYLYIVAENLYQYRDMDYNENDLVKLDLLLKRKLFEGTYPIEGMVDLLPKGIAQCHHLFGKE